MSITVLFVVLIMLIFFSGFFSAAETAFTSLSQYQISQLARDKSLFAKKASYLLQHRDHLLGTILVGNNIVNIAASSITTVLSMRLWGDASVSVASGVLTFVILVFGEVTPKQLALRYNEPFVRIASVPIAIFNVILRPIVVLVSLLGYVFNLLSGGKKDSKFSLDQLFFLIREGEADGMVETYEKKVVHNLFRLSEITVTQIMTHRRDVFSLPADMTVAEAMPRMIKENFSRVPLYDKNREDVIGLVFLSEVYTEHMAGHTKTKLKNLMHKPTFIPASFKVGEVLQIFKRESISLCIALDEYGGLAGIVSPKDILEEILGEMYLEPENDEEVITEIEGGGWRLPGETALYWLEDVVGYTIPHDKSVSTISGYLCERLGRFPVEDELCELPEGKFHIEKVLNNRICMLSFYPHSTQNNTESS